MTSGVIRAGLVGKLPAHGDFVRRGPAATAAWLDDWLAGELALMAPPLRADVLEALPLWMFAATDLPPGAVAGVLCASHDRVGRLYPLLVFVDDPAPAAAFAWADAIRAALEAGAPTIDADALIGAVEAAAPAMVTDQPPRRGTLWWNDSAAMADAIAMDAMPTAEQFASLLVSEAA